MSTDEPNPSVRPHQEDISRGLPGFSQFPSRLSSVRSLLLVAGAGSFLFGFIIWFFIRDLAGPGQIVMAIGAVLLIIDLVVSWRGVGRAVFGRRGRYGVNTVVIVSAFIAIAVLLNFYLFWLINRPDPIGWLRVDTTATKQFILSEQTISILENLEEPIRANAFFVTDNPEGAAAWQDTVDLLSEFKRRSSNFDYRLIDPELEPNVADEYEITGNPAIAIEHTVSRRSEVILGGDPGNGPQVFDETDITTALLVINQIQQKHVIFITGHGERDMFDLSDQSDGFGKAVQALMIDNYAVGAATIQELGNLLMQGAVPAVIVVAGPESDLIRDDSLSLDEESVIRAYLANGGSGLFLLEPNSPLSWRDLVGRYGVALGEGEMVDVSSFVAPNPRFLQLKHTNGQFLDYRVGTHPIMEPIDVVYMPGAAHVAQTVGLDTVPLADDGTPYFSFATLAATTLASWSETSDEIHFDVGDDQNGPLPVAVAVESIAEFNQYPVKSEDGEWLKTNLVVIGDSDFATNYFFTSAKNGDVFANSVNWLARDYKLISTRPKARVFRELVLTRTERDFVRWTGWLLMPAIVGSVGVASWWRRR